MELLQSWMEAIRWSTFIWTAHANDIATRMAMASSTSDYFNRVLPYRLKKSCLRLFALDDLSDFQAYRSDPELARYQGWTAMTDDDAKAFIGEMASCRHFRFGAWVQLAIGCHESNRLIGDIGVHIDFEEREAEIGFTVSSLYQRRGIASESVRAVIQMLFDQTNVLRVKGITDKRNVASTRTLMRTGMQQVGEQTVEFKGEECCELLFAITRP